MNLDSILKVVWRQRVVVASVLLIGLVCFGFAVSRGRSYSASSTVLAGSESPTNAAVLDPTKNPTESAISPTDLPTMVHSSTVIHRVAASLHLTPEHALKFAANIKAKISGVDTLPITVTDTNPHLAVLEANALARELGRFEQQIAESRYDMLIADLNGQLASERQTLDAVDQKIALMTSADPFLSAENGTTSVNAQIVALEAQRNVVRTQLLGDAATVGKESERPALTRDLASKEIVQNDPVFVNLRTQYGKDLAVYNQEQAGYTSNFAGLAGLKDMVKRENVSLGFATAQATKNPDASPTYVSAELDKNKAEAAYASDRSQLASLNSELAEAAAHLNDSRNSDVALQGLSRERTAGNQAYAQLSDRLAQAIADRSQAASVNSIVVLDEAVTASPTLLSRPPVIFAALAVMFSWLAISLAFLVDQSDGRLRNRTTIEDLYGTRVLTNV